MKVISNFISKETLFQLFTALIANLMAISDGMTVAWTAPMIPYFLSKKSHIKMTKSETEWLETSQLIGAVVGIPITVFLLNRTGRRRSLILACTLLLVSWVLTAIAHTANLIFVARFVNGVSGEMAFAAAVTYVVETADKRIRGLLSSFTYLMALIGVLVMYSTGPFLSYHIPCIIGAALLSLEIIVFNFFPETPYYLLYNNRNEDAKKSLEIFRCKSAVDSELKEIKDTLEKEKEEKGRVRDIFLIKSNRKALLIVVALNAAQQFSSYNAILMNLHEILDAAGSIYIKPTTSAILFAVLMPIAAVKVSLFVDKFGRRPLLIISSVLTAICLLTLAVYFHMKFLGYDVTKISWMPTVSVMVYAYVFKLGLGMVPIIIAAELFPTNIRAMCVTISGSIYSFMALLSLQVYHPLKNAFGIHIPFYVFSFCAFLTVIFVVVVVPETKGKSLEEIQVMLRQEKPEEILH